MWIGCGMKSHPIWTIYCHTHTESGRRYIGLTQYTMMHRWNQHCAQAKNAKNNRSHFVSAIRKYGKKAFSHEILAQSWDLEGANITEETLIRQEDTRNPKTGFNLAKGGLHVPHPIRRNPWNNPEYREKQLPRLKVWSRSSALHMKSKATLNTPESRSKRIKSSKIIWSDQNRRSNLSDKIRRIAETYDGRKQRSIASKIWHYENDKPLFKHSSEYKEKMRKFFKQKYEQSLETKKICPIHGPTELHIVQRKLRRPIVYCKHCFRISTAKYKKTYRLKLKKLAEII